MTVRTATQLLLLIENTLGCTQDVYDERPIWKWRATEAGKINRKIEKNPKLYTWHNLELAVAYLWKQRKPLKTPFGVFYAVEDALAESLQEERRPVGDLIDEAIRIERDLERPGWEEWCSQLTRAFGNYRAGVYEEWAAARRP